MPVSHSIRRRYSFEAAHFLPLVPDGHKCKRMHGHNYEFEVVVSGQLDKRGWVLDFWDLDAIVNPIVERLDHRLLNEIEGLENPTAEVIAAWLMTRIDKAVRALAGSKAALRGVAGVYVYETKDAIAECLNLA